MSLLLNQLVAMCDAIRVPAKSPALVRESLRSKLPVLMRDTDFPGRLEDMDNLYVQKILAFRPRPEQFFPAPLLHYTDRKR
uniref:Uncharacterized protein n=1 Tax=Marinobacter nauticus TaxID=2743 RepID=A0A455W1F7_MARNT|nr:hypothetical protein YBY_08340 [Marinobacter nauticus]